MHAERAGCDYRVYHRTASKEDSAFIASIESRAVERSMLTTVLSCSDALYIIEHLQSPGTPSHHKPEVSDAPHRIVQEPHVSTNLLNFLLHVCSILCRCFCQHSGLTWSGCHCQRTLQSTCLSQHAASVMDALWLRHLVRPPKISAWRPMRATDWRPMGHVTYPLPANPQMQAVRCPWN